MVEGVGRCKNMRVGGYRCKRRTCTNTGLDSLHRE